MKHIVFTVTLMGLLTGVGFAQHGRMATGGNRGMSQTERWGQPPAQVVRPNAVQMGRTANRPNASKPATGTSQSSQSGVGSNHHTVAPPDAAVGPSVSNRKLQN